jgi:hypothetical protein
LVLVEELNLLVLLHNLPLYLLLLAVAREQVVAPQEVAVLAVVEEAKQLIMVLEAELLVGITAEVDMLVDNAVVVVAVVRVQ